MNSPQPGIYDPEYVKALFNEMCASYDRVNLVASFGFSQRWRKQFLQPVAASNEPLQIIDLMAGAGETWSNIRKRFPNAELTAVDISDQMLLRAGARNHRHFKQAVILREADVLSSELPEGRYDLVVSAFGLKTFSNDQVGRLAQVVHHLLKPGGQFTFIEISRPHNALLRALYRIHLAGVVPVMGRLLLGNPVQYRALWQYTTLYVDSRKAAAQFSAAGLDVHFVSYFGGCATGIYGRKPKSR